VPVVETKIETPIEKKNITPEIESTFERGTPQYFDAEIESRQATATSAENRARFLRLELAAQTTTDLDAIKKWTAESTLARKLREEIARLQIQKADAETAITKDERSQADITKEKIAALKGRRQ
jgi:hypothetical protein